MPPAAACCRWNKIAQLLPGRTIAAVRNRYQRIAEGRKMREEGKESKNLCHACGMPKRGHVCEAKRGQSSVADQLPAWAHDVAARAASRLCCGRATAGSTRAARASTRGPARCTAPSSSRHYAA